MSLRDRLRGRRGGDGGDAGDGGSGTAHDGDGSTARDDVTDFDPRSDGEYHCAANGLYLRFARPAVTENVSQADPAAPGPARGEFTAAGRFTVQRRFGRAVVYTVLAVGENALSLTVRRTDTADRASAELEFTFEQDGPRPG